MLTMPLIEIISQSRECNVVHGIATPTPEISPTSRTLPGAICRAQQATFDNDHSVLRKAMNQIIHIIEERARSFPSSDTRPLSNRYMDPVEFTRCTSAYCTGVVKGEKTVSGLLFPDMHFMDAFLTRHSFQSAVGHLAVEERDWIPKLHRDILDAVQATSVFDYMNAIPVDEERQSLLSLYQRVLS